MSKKVIVIDDELGIREFLTSYLTSHFQVEVLTAATPLEAIKQICSTPDLALIICDFNLIDGTGAQVKQFLDIVGLKIPFIGYTGQSEEFQSFGLNAVIDKCDIDSLKNAVTAVFQEKPAK